MDGRSTLGKPPEQWVVPPRVGEADGGDTPDRPRLVLPDRSTEGDRPQLVAQADQQSGDLGADCLGDQLFGLSEPRILSVVHRAHLATQNDQGVPGCQRCRYCVASVWMHDPHVGTQLGPGHQARRAIGLVLHDQDHGVTSRR